MDEAALLKTVLSGDLDAILVYADWLEEQNHLSRANFMRMQHRLLARIAPPSKPLPRSRTRKGLTAQERALVESASELFAAGKRLPQNFVAKVALPPLLTTYWDGADSDAARRQLHFCEDGVLDWASPTGRYVDGTWVQIGNALRMTINNEYVTLEGVIVGDQIFGTALNVNDFT